MFLSASEEINKKPEEYWTLVMDVAKRNSLGRIKRCGTIMGRDEGEELTAAQIMYPCMQCADIFYLKASPALLSGPFRCSSNHPVLCWRPRVPTRCSKNGGAAMQADICQLGMDQRKVNMLAREYCDDIKRKLKPIIISHAMLPGLLEVPSLDLKLCPFLAAKDCNSAYCTLLWRLNHLIEFSSVRAYVSHGN